LSNQQFSIVNCQLSIVNCQLSIVNKTSGAEADLLLIGFLHRKQIISEKRV